ncbi:hypothetical protein O1M54_06420 [Streptomyces diastatochromogenes]|nr:hypothetical protein [Streptomyces diastatochromogenes]
MHTTVGRALELARQWLAEDALNDLPLVVLTSGAVATAEGEDVRDLGAAAAWGLLRSAQSEAPGRIVLADVPDPDAAGLDTVLSAVVASGEPQVAVRDTPSVDPGHRRPAGPGASPDPRGAARSNRHAGRGLWWQRADPVGRGVRWHGTDRVGRGLRRHRAAGVGRVCSRLRRLRADRVGRGLPQHRADRVGR